MKNKRIAIAVLLAMVVLLAVMYYRSTYPIELNHVTLPKIVQNYCNRGTKQNEVQSVELYNGITLGDKLYYLIEVDEMLGYVRLEEGFFGGFRIARMGYGSGDFRVGIIECNGTKYWLLGGRDLSEQIALVTVELEGVVYHLPIDNRKDRFLVYTELDYAGDVSHMNRDCIKLYNAEGDDITDRYNLSGGGIY